MVSANSYNRHSQHFHHSFISPFILLIFIFSIALEILEVVPDPDIVAVCCGGAGLVSGIAAGLKLSGCEKCKVYAVEPVGGKEYFIESYYNQIKL